MKKIIFSLLMLLLAAVSVFAQAPQKMSYQAVVRNASDILVANQNVSAQISILHGSATGDVVYSETHNAKTNANGLLTIELGNGNVVSGDFAQIDWSAGPFFLKTQIDPEGGINYSVTSTQQMLSVPYAFYANQAGNGFSGNYNDLTNKPEIPTVPDKVSAFENDKGYITQAEVNNAVNEYNQAAGYLKEEKDPTVPSWAKEANKPNYDYSEIKNTPTIPTVPTNVSAFNNDKDYITSADVPAQVNADWNATSGVSQIKNKPALANVATSGNYNDLKNKPELFSGNYNDLNNKPTIPTVPTNVSAFNNDKGYITSADVPAQVNADWNATSGVSQIKNKPALANVATSGNYNDLKNKPELFSGNYNDLSNKPAIPTVPANVSAFNNDKGYITSADVPTNVSAFNNDAGYITAANVQEAANIPTKVSAFENDKGYITSADVPAQVNADWNATSGTSQIKNKPALANVATSGNYNDLSNKPELFSGNYNDLSNKPTIPTVPTNVSAFNNDKGYITSADVPAQVNADWNATSGVSQIKNKPALANVATSGNYNDLSNKPTIPTVPTNVSAFNNDAGYITAANVQEAANIPTKVSAFENDKGYITSADVPAQVNADWNATSGVSQIKNKPALANVATSGNYNDLSNKPTIPTIPANVSAFNNDAGYITKTDVDNAIIDNNESAGFLKEESDPTVPSWAKAADKPEYTYDEILNTPTLFDGNYNSLTNKPDLFNGDYNSLKNKPVIPEYANDATLTLQKNGDKLGTFTADAATDKTINITVPTTTNDLTNNSGFVSNSDCSSNSFCDLVNQIGNLQNTISSLQNRISFLESTISSMQGTMQDMHNTTDVMKDRINNRNNPPKQFQCGISKITDHEGNVYNTVQIGTQCWTKENMRCRTSPSTNTFILEAKPNSYSYSGKKAYFVNGDDNNTMTYGLLYNWNAAVDTFNTSLGETSTNTSSNTAVSVTFSGNRRGICPEGWHIPSDAEWSILTDYVDSQSKYLCDGQNAKSLASTTGWVENSRRCSIGSMPEKNDLTGFSALPAGSYDGSVLYYFGERTNFFSSTQTSKSLADQRVLLSNGDYMQDGSSFKYLGFSVRCILDKDESQEDNPDATIPTITTSLSAVSGTSAAIIGEVTDNGGAAVTDRGICWSTHPNPTIADNYQRNGSGNGSFRGGIDGLAMGTTYYVRAYAINSVGTAYGNEVSFSTSTLPTVNILDISDITGTTVLAQGNISLDEDVYDLGFCFSTFPNPLYNDNPIHCDNIKGSFSGTISGLTPGTKYYMRAFASNSMGVSYSDEINFTTLSMPTVTIGTIYEITKASAIVGINITNDGGSPITDCGTCWSTSHNPTIADSHTDHGNKIGYFNDGISGLSAATTYYVRTYATNSLGTTYSDEKSFTTPSLPTISTNVIDNIKETTALAHGNISNDGDSYVTDRGFCWSTSPNPTISGKHIQSGKGSGSFSATIPGLLPNTTYYVRAYATNDVGTSYGSERSFKTLTFTCGTSQVTDHEGNAYNTVLIGTQCWTKENMRCSTSPSTGTNIIISAPTYGYAPCKMAVESSGIYYYNWWAAVDTFDVKYGETFTTHNIQVPSIEFTGNHRRGICPQGWHIPDIYERETLKDYVSSKKEYLCDNNDPYSVNIAKALASTTGWKASDVQCAPGNDLSANNATGFSAVAYGYYTFGTNNYHQYTTGAKFWTSSISYKASLAGWVEMEILNLEYNVPQLISNTVWDPNDALTVRCIRD